MYLLAIETTGKLGSVALMNNQGLIKEKITTEEMSHLKKLTFLIDELLKEEDITAKDLDAIAVSEGPGSFTGIRIGVTTARTLGQFLNIPVIPVLSLEIFAEESKSDRIIVPIFNARRGQVYGAIYGNEKKELKKAGPYMLDEVLDSLNLIMQSKENESDKLICFYGDGIDAYKNEIIDFAKEHSLNIEFADENLRYQKAVRVARLGKNNFDKDKYPKSYKDVEANYMRISEAEQKLKDGTLAKQRAAKMAKFRGKITKA